MQKLIDWKKQADNRFFFIESRPNHFSILLGIGTGFGEQVMVDLKEDQTVDQLIDEVLQEADEKWQLVTDEKVVELLLTPEKVKDEVIEVKFKNELVLWKLTTPIKASIGGTTIEHWQQLISKELDRCLAQAAQKSTGE